MLHPVHRLCPHQGSARGLPVWLVHASGLFLCLVIVSLLPVSALNDISWIRTEGGYVQFPGLSPNLLSAHWGQCEENTLILAQNSVWGIHRTLKLKIQVLRCYLLFFFQTHICHSKGSRKGGINHEWYWRFWISWSFLSKSFRRRVRRTVVTETASMFVGEKSGGHGLWWAKTVIDAWWFKFWGRVERERGLQTPFGVSLRDPPRAPHCFSISPLNPGVRMCSTLKLHHLTHA